MKYYTNKEQFLNDAYGKVMVQTYNETILTRPNIIEELRCWIVCDVDDSGWVYGYRTNRERSDYERIRRLNDLGFWEIGDAEHQDYWHFVDDNSRTEIILEYFNNDLDRIKDMIYTGDIKIENDGRLILTNGEYDEEI